MTHLLVCRRVRFIEQGVNVTDAAQIFERSGTTQILLGDKWHHEACRPCWV
jgi:hypothetical protein